MLKRPEKVVKKIFPLRLEGEAIERLKQHAEKKNTDPTKIIRNLVRDYIEKMSSRK